MQVDGAGGRKVLNDTDDDDNACRSCSTDPSTCCAVPPTTCLVDRLFDEAEVEFLSLELDDEECGEAAEATGRVTVGAATTGDGANGLGAGEAAAACGAGAASSGRLLNGEAEYVKGDENSGLLPSAAE